MQIKEAENPHLDYSDHYLRQVETMWWKEERFVVRIQDEY